jgi:medium-chain acyl-[acyl-carrier-protein] hydrolase
MSKPEPPTSRSRGWVHFFGPQHPFARLRLICFPYAGGTIQTFARWRGTLPRDVSLGAVELPGHGLRLLESPVDRMQDVVHWTVAELEPYLDLPIALFGHSMGGLIAFEVARALRQSSLASPSWLFVSAREAPQVPLVPSSIHEMPQAEFRQTIRGYGATPAEVLAQPDIMKLIEPALRADFAICETYAYSPGSPLHCPISAFWGTADPLMARSTMTAWREQTNSDFTLQDMPGAHFFMQTAERVLLQLLARDLTECITRERSGLCAPA